MKERGPDARKPSVAPSSFASSPAPDELPSEADALARARKLAEQAVVEARKGAARASELAPHPDASRFARFGYGAALPFALARVAFRDPAFRRRYLWTVGYQFTVVVVLGVWLTLSSREIGITLIKAGAEHIERAGTPGFLAALYATLCAVEWVVLALTRDFQTVLGREISLRAGIAPEDEDIDPRIRVNGPWLRRKLKNRIRGAIVFATILPLTALGREIPIVGPAIASLLFAAWAIYWAGVFVTAKSALAWDNEATAPDPIYVRAAESRFATVPVLAWLARVYARLWRTLTRSMFAPASHYERSPFELSGLSLARIIRYVPGAYLLVRPLYPVAASHLLLASKRESDSLNAAPRASAPSPLFGP